jgi:hypothetical protein
MPGTVLFTGPAPPAASLGFCLVCAATAKHAAYQPIRGEVELFEKQESGTRTWPLRMHRPPALAVAWGLYPALGVSGPLCWSHLTMIDIRATAVLPATAGMMPPERHGAVHLDQPH